MCGCGCDGEGGNYGCGSGGEWLRLGGDVGGNVGWLEASGGSGGSGVA